MIPKGGADAVRKKGMELLRSQIVEIVPRFQIVLPNSRAGIRSAC